MRLRKSVPFALTAAAPALGLAPASAPAQALTPVGAAENLRPTCAAPDTRAFPITTRIHGGPSAYEVGGESRTWYIDLTNTTANTCGNIHPIVVLVDDLRSLRPEQTRLEFYDGERAHPVAFEKSDEDESVGAFDDGFPGFTVGPGRTLTVKVRLSVTSDAAVPNNVVANAAVVQRHNNDGDWVGESNEYRFRIDEKQGEASDRDGDDGGDDDSDDDGGTSTATDGGGVRGDSQAEPAAEPDAQPDAAPQRTPSADQLASTGSGAPHGLAAAASAVLFALGVVLVAASRWFRAGRR
ncbi:hypothetical protein AB0D57_23200 [Streptomyces sp. NPDC048275]|uniref:hypothetical protein n=1 Tax=Streptomyces sp. NPDC048275 TaxID=3155629 RepID=UPI0033CB6424